MLGAHRQSGCLCFFFLNNKKNPHFNSISLPPLWGNLYRKSTHLWCGCVNTHQPRERCGPAGCWGGGLWNEGWAQVYSEQCREGTLTLLIAQANLTVVTPLQSHWSVKMLFLQARLPLRNVVRWQLPSSLSPHSHRTRQGQFPPHLPPSRSRCLANQVPASFLFF